MNDYKKIDQIYVTKDIATLGLIRLSTSDKDVLKIEVKDKKVFVLFENIEGVPELKLYALGVDAFYQLKEAIWDCEEKIKVAIKEKNRELKRLRETKKWLNEESDKIIDHQIMMMEIDSID